MRSVATVGRIAPTGAVIAALLAGGCGPLSHLQSFRAKALLPDSHAYPELGFRETTLDVGGSMAASFRRPSTAFTDGTYYDFARDTVAPDEPNCFFTLGRHSAGLFVGLQGENLVSGLGELRMGLLGGRMFYDMSAGIGVRLYADRVAGRLYNTVGLSNMRIDVLVHERGGEYGWDLTDSYRDLHPTFGLNLTINSLRTNAPLQYYVGLSTKYRSCFRYEAIDVDLSASSLSMGVFRRNGPFLLLAGLKLNYITSFTVRETDTLPHYLWPAVVVQFRSTFGRR
jgi:hypothetical protein